ncbi:MAG TPA: PH domain-containing protein, partial [Thermomonospora sp.]|nr:PH domain-containing protein [Thermomonospora sp.]
VITSGVLVRRLVVVPYGRMQVVDVSAGLLERWMGIATVRLHTAAAATDARIPGVPAAEAAQLRDRLARRGEARSMGL